MDPIIEQFCREAYNELVDLYYNDEFEACIEKAYKLLDDEGLPRYHRMKTWMLLGNCLVDWEEANECFVKAQEMWWTVRREHTFCEDAHADEMLEELAGELEELNAVLDADEDKPEGVLAGSNRDI